MNGCIPCHVGPSKIVESNRVEWHTEAMRRASLFVLVLCLLSAVGPTAASESGATTLAACTTSQLNVIAYNVSVAAGTVGELFWVADTGARACTLRGYARVTYSGNYGFVQSKKPAQPLAVTEEHGRRYVDMAGVAKDRVLPTVTLAPSGAIASFWIFGTDEPHQLADGHQSRCIFSNVMYVWMTRSTSGLLVEPERASNFVWCGPVTVYPVVAGDTGSDPPFPLNRMFGPNP